VSRQEPSLIFTSASVHRQHNSTARVLGSAFGHRADLFAAVAQYRFCKSYELHSLWTTVDKSAMMASLPLSVPHQSNTVVGLGIAHAGAIFSETRG
jgi:hypothetical protein